MTDDKLVAKGVGRRGQQASAIPGAMCAPPSNDMMLVVDVTRLGLIFSKIVKKKNCMASRPPLSADFVTFGRHPPVSYTTQSIKPRRRRALEKKHG